MLNHIKSKDANKETLEIDCFENTVTCRGDTESSYLVLTDTLYHDQLRIRIVTPLIVSVAMLFLRAIKLKVLG